MTLDVQSPPPKTGNMTSGTSVENNFIYILRSQSPPSYSHFVPAESTRTSSNKPTCDTTLLRRTATATETLDATMPREVTQRPDNPETEHPIVHGAGDEDVSTGHTVEESNISG